jgi:hypothetical protein
VAGESEDDDDILSHIVKNNFQSPVKKDGRGGKEPVCFYMSGGTAMKKMANYNFKLLIFMFKMALHVCFLISVFIY